MRIRTVLRILSLLPVTVDSPSVLGQPACLLGLHRRLTARKQEGKRHEGDGADSDDSAGC